ncbi:MAG: SGNH/GDSL hydrolase family protein, partial [Clostridia bacterium]|nr:SGNH/GDSL hydrolase family protein [Clostridia bacterium]
EESSMKPLCEEKEIAVNIFGDKDEINIVYLGGSITEGVGASNSKQTSYRALVGKYFTETYPDMKVNNVHQGVGGTGSDYGLMRLQRDVISYNPDLVFVEFAVNDNGKDSRLEMESIVRTLNNLENPPYIIYLYTTRSSFANVKTYHVEVAEHYGIPQIDLQRELKETMVATGNDVSVYLPDGVHPSDAGHKVYADKIIECLESGKYYRYTVVTDQKLVDTSCVADISCINAKDAALTCSWTEATCNFSRSVMFSETAGDTMTFTFTGNFFGLEHALNLAGGKYEVYVDGELYNTNHCYYRNVNYYHSRFGCADFLLDYDTHTVEIKVLGTKPTDDSTGTKVCMVNLFYGTIDR